MSSIVERMETVLVVNDEYIVALEALDDGLLALGVLVEAESPEAFIEGAQEVVETFDISEDDRQELTEILGTLLALGAAGYAAKKAKGWWQNHQDRSLEKEHATASRDYQRAHMKHQIQQYKQGASDLGASTAPAGPGLARRAAGHVANAVGRGVVAGAKGAAKGAAWGAKAAGSLALKGAKAAGSAAKGKYTDWRSKRAGAAPTWVEPSPKKSAQPSGNNSKTVVDNPSSSPSSSKTGAMPATVDTSMAKVGVHPAVDPSTFKTGIHPSTKFPGPPDASQKAAKQRRNNKRAGQRIKAVPTPQSSAHAHAMRSGGRGNRGF